MNRSRQRKMSIMPVTHIHECVKYRQGCARKPHTMYLKNTTKTRGENAARVIALIQISAVFVKTVVMSWGDGSPLPCCAYGISFQHPRVIDEFSTFI